MKQEDKELLLKDLCARLSYGVKVQDTYYSSLKPITPWLVDMIKHEVRLYADENWQSIENIKSYLRPMSSMTEEEEKELQQINHRFYKDRTYIYAGVFGADDCGCTVWEMAEILNYLNTHHFDYRGLIEKGLALEAPEGMYKTE